MARRGLLRILVAALLVLQGPARCHAHAWVRLPPPAPPSTPQHVPSINTRQQCPTFRIAVINGVNFHFEVLGSLLHVLVPYADQVDVYVSPHAKTANFNGAWDLLSWFPGQFKKSDSTAFNNAYDLVFLVSPDYELQENLRQLRHMKPKLVVPIVHNGRFDGLPQIQELTAAVHPLTLSPHVADALAAHTNRTVGWMLPAFPATIKEDCLTFPRRWVLGLCLRGFALQGKFSNLRRNYSGIWHQMQAKLPAIKDPQVGRVLHVNVLGKGQDRLKLPPQLEMHVAVHRKLQYSAFFNSLAHNVALLPSLASDKYYTQKFSSTILTSFISGTPVLASERLLQAYSFLERDAVYVQQAGEEEVDAMVRISQLRTDDIIKVRLALLELRAKLNKAAGEKLEQLVHPLCLGKAGGAIR